MPGAATSVTARRLSRYKLLLLPVFQSSRYTSEGPGKFSVYSTSASPLPSAANRTRVMRPKIDVVEGFQLFPPSFDSSRSESDGHSRRLVADSGSTHAGSPWSSRRGGRLEPTMRPACLPGEKSIQV